MHSHPSPPNGRRNGPQYESFRNRLLASTNIINMGRSSRVPSGRLPRRPRSARASRASLRGARTSTSTRTARARSSCWTPCSAARSPCGTATRRGAAAASPRAASCGSSWETLAVAAAGRRCCDAISKQNHRGRSADGGVPYTQGERASVRAHVAAAACAMARARCRRLLGRHMPAHMHVCMQ